MHYRIALLVIVGLLAQACAIGAHAVGARAAAAHARPSRLLLLPSKAEAGPPIPGDRLFAAADFDRAERAYRSTLKSDRHNAAAQLGLARIALYRNQLDEAESHARALATDAPTDPHVKRLLRSIAERRDQGPNYRVTMTAAQVDLPFLRTAPLPEIELLVDGKPAHVLLDTGAPGLSLSSSFVKRLGLATNPAGVGVFAGGLRRNLGMGHVDRLDMGGASIRSIPISVLDEFPPGIDGVLGTNVLYRFLSTIDYADGRLVLRPKTASKSFEARASARGAVIVPMLLVPDHFIFARARVGRAPEALFSVDTGGAGVGVQLTKTELDAAAIVPDAAHPSVFRGGGGPTRILPFSADVTLGNLTVRGAPGVYSPDGDPYGIFPFRVAGTVSQELFKRGALTFDFSAMKLVFDARRQPSWTSYRPQT